MPYDAEIVGYTWQYLNRDGGRDRRFRYNREIPVCLYGQLALFEETGLQERLLTSKSWAADVLRECFQNMSAAVAADLAPGPKTIRGESRVIQEEQTLPVPIRREQDLNSNFRQQRKTSFPAWVVWCSVCVVIGSLVAVMYPRFTKPRASQEQYDDSPNSVLNPRMDAFQELIGPMLLAELHNDARKVQAGLLQIGKLPKPHRPGGHLATEARTKNARGTKLFKQGHYKEAAEMYAAALAADPGDAEIADNMGHALYRFGSVDAARAAALTAIRLAPERATAWVTLACALAVAGDHDSASAAFGLFLRFSKYPKNAFTSLRKLAEEDPHPSVRIAATAAIDRLIAEVF